MCGSPSVPQGHDPSQTAQQQQQYNTQAGQASQAGSMVNQSNPYGSLSYQQIGTNPDGTPKYSATQTYSPQQQAMFNALMGTQTTAANAANPLLASGNYGSAPDITGTANSLTGQRMSDYLASVKPDQQNQVSWKDNELRNQGILPGTPAYDSAMRPIVQGQNQANLGAAAQFQPQAFQEAITQYQLPMQTAMQLAGFGSPGSINQNLTNTPGLNIQPANYSGAVATADQIAQQNYQAQLAQQSSMLNSIMGLGGTVIGGALRCDMNIKTNRKPADGEEVLTKLRKVPVDRFDYTDEARAAYMLPESRTGPMAQDWKQEFGGDGRTIDIGDLLGQILAAVKALDERTKHLVQEV